jgi:HAD superfamily hydrolase (TIGR01490 family)
VKERKEGNETREVKGVKEKSGVIAAFFDLDGTLVALPSLERTFFRVLRYRKEISARNYFLWMKEALRLIPRGMGAILHSNRMYLRGVRILDECDGRGGNVSSWHKDGHQAKGQASAPPRCHPRQPVPRFFAQALERVTWHARQGHKIVFLSGTIEPLARGVARTLEVELAARGITLTIRVLATRLEEGDGRWTGRILGEAVAGEAKARAAKRLAEELRLDLDRCYAYGDTLNDMELLAAVGNPAAVNPSKKLASLALSQGWTMLPWKEKEKLTQKRGGREEVTKEEKATRRVCCLELVSPENPE